MLKKLGLLMIPFLLLSALIMAQDNPIEISILNLSDGMRLTEGLEIEVQVTVDPEYQLKEVELLLDDISQGKLSDEPPYVFSLKNIRPNSVHRLQARAETTSGLIALDTRLVSKESESDYSLQVDLITLYVSVNDSNGNYVRGLTADDFVVSEENETQEIAFFSSENTPLKLAFLMDISSSMIGERIIRSQNAAIDLVDNLLKKEDEAMVLGFDDKLRMYQKLTSDLDAIKEAIYLTGPNGGTALYDAVAGTVRRLFDIKGKRAIILLSDGDDTDSEFRSDEVLDYLQKSSVMVYSVGLQTLTSAQTRASETRQTMQNLRDMAEFSGGYAYFPSFISHLPEVYAAIGKDLSSQYTISYYPKNRVKDGRWRSISVSVKNRSDLAIRHRKGYYAN